MTESAHRPIVRCECRRQWRDWLAGHFESESEVWFVFPTKDSGEEGVTYNDAVEEALCFGWIDSTAGTLDPTHQLRRFTPRKKGSPYSVIGIIRAPYIFPEDILSALREDVTVWKNYLSFPEPYRRIRVAYIDAARKRPEEFARRLSNFIYKTRRNKLIVGYGGVDKYY